MNWSKLIWAAIVVFVALVITDLIIHLVLLKGMYQNLAAAGIFRPWDSMMCYWWVILITMLAYAFFFTFIFVKGYEGKGMAEALRYAIYITLFICFVFSFIQFVLYEVPYGLAWLWIVLGFVQNLIMAILAALIYKPKAAAA